MEYNIAWLLWCLIGGIICVYAGYQAIIKRSKFWAILFSLYLAQVWMDNVYKHNNGIVAEQLKKLTNKAEGE